MEYDVITLLPHRFPMIFISDVNECNLEDNKLTAQVNIKETDILYQDNIKGVPSYASLEYMAQAIGCFVGRYDLENNPNAKPGIGFVIGTRKLKIFSSVLKADCTYYVDVKSIFFDNTIASFECTMYNKESVIAEATINAYRPTSIELFMKENT